MKKLLSIVLAALMLCTVLSLTAFAEEREVKAGRPMWQARIAVSGCAVTPGGPGEIMEILGREESLRRLDAAVARLTE